MPCRQPVALIALRDNRRKRLDSRVFVARVGRASVHRRAGVKIGRCIHRSGIRRSAESARAALASVCGGAAKAARTGTDSADGSRASRTTRTAAGTIGRWVDAWPDARCGQTHHDQRQDNWDKPPMRCDLHAVSAWQAVMRDSSKRAHANH